MFQSLRGDLTSESLQHHLSHCLPVVRKQDFPLPSPAPEHKVQLRRSKLDPTSQLSLGGGGRGRQGPGNKCFLQHLLSSANWFPALLHPPHHHHPCHVTGPLWIRNRGRTQRHCATYSSRSFLKNLNFEALFCLKSPFRGSGNFRLCFFWHWKGVTRS